MAFFSKINLDFAGLTASVICALHCIAVPIILSLGVANSSHLMHDHSFDIVVIALGIVIATFSLLGDFKKHRSLLPIMLVILGFSILTTGILMGHDTFHVFMSVIGSSFVASAHYINWKKGRNFAFQCSNRRQ